MKINLGYQNQQGKLGPTIHLSLATMNYVRNTIQYVKSLWNNIADYFHRKMRICGGKGVNSSFIDPVTE